jgi:tetratricopeptide (TPR) repeat protein
MQNYQQVVERMTKPASTVPQITAEEGALIVEELEATAPVIDQPYPDEVAIAVRSAVTDADLFLSYNLPDKAIGPLQAALERVPRDVRVNQRLAALHTRFHHFAEAAACCRTLASVFHDAGHPDEAVRYRELAARYEQNAGGGTAVAAPVEHLESVAAALPVLGDLDQTAPPEFAVQATEVPSSTDDLSSEWENALSVVPVEPGEVSTVTWDCAEENPEIAETVDEIRFYLEHLMPDQARTAFEKLATLTHSPSVLDPIRIALESAVKSDEPEVEISELPDADLPDNELPTINADEPETFHIELKPQPAPGVIPSQERKQTPTRPAQASELSKSDELSALVADLEASIGEFPVAPAAADTELTTQSAMSQISESASSEELPGWQGKAAIKRGAAGHAKRKPEPLASTPAPVAETKAVISAGNGGAAAAAAPAMSYTPAPLHPLGDDIVHPSHSVDLSEMFSELRHELEEDVAPGVEDPETHYNMGVAFREMGLLDEAIAELQTVCTAIDRGHEFSQVIQTYTWLAQCFLDKGVPEAAIRWYEKALGIPGLDNETRLAINYELGSACESAQDRPAALRHFTYVYGANIDYRDVAERIQALKS